MNSLRHIFLIALSLILIFAKSALLESSSGCYDESTKQHYHEGQEIQLENECKLLACMDDGTFEVYGCPEYIYASKRIRRDVLKKPFPKCCPLWDHLNGKSSNNNIKDKKKTN